MNILPGIKIIDLALSINNNLVIADTHIGYEEALNKQGILIPRFQFKEIIERLERIFNVLSKNNSRGGWGTTSNSIKHNLKISPLLKNKEKINKKLFDKIIINGDIKHEFGTISEQEWRHTLRLLDFLAKYCKEIILIKGNHDNVLGPIAKKRNVRVVDHLILSCPPKSPGSVRIGGLTDKYKKLKNKILITHGDKIPSKSTLKDIKTVIIAHEHPAVTLKEGPRHELYKAFLKGKWKGHNLIVQPSLNLVTEGTDVMKEKLLSPFLQQDLRNFEAFIVADRVYGFGRLKDL